MVRPWAKSEFFPRPTYITRNPFTASFRHLQEVQKKILLRREGKRLKVARASERIKWWNIVPGDQVRVMARNETVVREVTAIDKLANRVYVQSDKKSDDANAQNPRNVALNVHYSGLQLYIGHHQFPPAESSGEPRSLPVFAVRLGTTQPVFEKGRWIWERFAVATRPRLPDWQPGKRERIPIPWPKREDPPPQEPTQYDTPKEAVAEVTYIPAPVPADVPDLVTVTEQLKHTYIDMLRGSAPFDQTHPIELLVARELSNPHSRAKKRMRWHAAQQRKHALLQEFMRAELETLGARTRREARLEAEFKWRRHVQAERKLALKNRWEQRGQKARLERRTARKRAKVERQNRRLRDLVLLSAPHQVVPQMHAS